MKRFKSVNLPIEINHINQSIFDCEEKAKTSGFGGFRESGFDKVKSNFFTFVFLCGGNQKEHDSRKLLSSILKKNDNVKIIISENLEKFKGNLDLLTFETVLEAVSKMILIPLESFGTACELGAFTRIDDENNKVVAIINSDHAADKSFINFGPIQLLREIGGERVITASFIQSGGKLYLRTNTEINNLCNHDLITNQIKITKYFKKKETDEDNGFITNLNSFLIAVLDYVCLTGFATVDMIMDFFSLLIKDNSFSIYSSVMKIDNNRIKDVISSFLHILESIDFLDEDDGVFFVNSNVLAPQMKNGERWIGKVLFTNGFTVTDEYIKIKCTCEDIKNRIIKYGYHK